MILVPKDMPAFFAEAKLIKVGAKLTCTEIQKDRLEELWRPPHIFSCILGYGFRRERLYVGNFGDRLDDCLSIPRPDRLDSTAWEITELLRQLAFRDQCGINNQIEAGMEHDAPDAGTTTRSAARPR